MKTVLLHERPTSGAKQSRPAQHRPNLAARVGRWSAAHWKTATFGWLALVLVAFAVGGLVGTKQADPTMNSTAIQRPSAPGRLRWRRDAQSSTREQQNDNCQGA